MQAAVMAARVGLDVSYIGTLEGEGVTTVPVADEEAGHRKMVELLESGAADAAVTMHFPFPIGVSTVGRVVTPARGKSMFLATTTGTSSANRLEGMILNTIYGIITAKACGIQEPTVGILNVDGAVPPRRWPCYTGSAAPAPPPRPPWKDSRQRPRCPPPSGSCGL